MHSRNEELLHLLLWTIDTLVSPTFYNINEGYESWAYRKGLLGRFSILQRNRFLERDPDRSKGKAYRLTQKGRLHALGGRDPEAWWSRDWDGLWRLVLIDIPVKQNNRRDKLRRSLRDKGFGHLQKSVWITPDPLRERWEGMLGGKVDVTLLSQLEARPCGGQSDAEIVSAAWDFKTINHLYAIELKLLEECPIAQARADSPAKELRRWAAVERDAWLSAVSTDPLLPDQLLPKDYLGRRAWKKRLELLRATA